MMRHPIIFVMLGAGIALANTACPFDTTFAKAAKGERLRMLASLDPRTSVDDCMCALADAMRGETDLAVFDQFLKTLERWSAARGFSLALLARCADLERVRTDSAAGKRIVSLWERRNDPLAVAVDRLLDAGRLDEADSLLQACHRCIRLGTDVLLTWADIASLRHSYGEAARLCCRAIDREPRLAGLVLNRLEIIFENAPRDSVRRMLGLFERCATAAKNADTLMILRWVAGEYARRDCTGEEIESVRRFPVSDVAATGRLLDIARIRSGRGAHAQAIQAARIAYTRAPDDRIGKAAAMVLCQSFARLGELDSALVWLERCDRSHESAAVEAAVLYQRTGRLREAEAMIERVRRRIIRDTLRIRQKIFAGDPEGAQAVCAGAAAGWSADKRAAAVWKARCAVFSGKTDELGALLDTLAAADGAAPPRELLEYRYYWNALSGSREAMETWSRIEFDLYAGDPARAVGRLQAQPLPGDIRSTLALRVIRGIRACGDAALLEKTILLLPDPVSNPEILYLHAEALSATEAGTARAMELLHRVIRDFPADLFAQKARALLAKLRDRS